MHTVCTALLCADLTEFLLGPEEKWACELAWVYSGGSGSKIGTWRCHGNHKPVVSHCVRYS